MGYGAIDREGLCVNALEMSATTAEKLIPVLKDQYGYADIVDLPAGYSVGDYYEDGEWRHAAPPPKPKTLAEAQAQKRVELMTARDAEVAKGFHYQGHAYPLTEQDRLNMMIQFQASQVQPAPHYQWKDIDLIYRDIGDAQALAIFITSALAFGEVYYTREAQLQYLVNHATTIEQVEAIDWDTPVPDGAI